jgi:hypothetical protein
MIEAAMRLLQRNGYARARELATLVVADLEGSLLLARVTQDTGPITLAAEAMAHLIDSETAVRGGGIA